MGDAGEGLIDADARIQERMEEVARERAERRANAAPRDPRTIEALESLRLARAEMQRQYDATTQAPRRKVIEQALAEIDGRLAALEAGADR